MLVFDDLWARSLSLLHSGERWICFSAATFRDIVEHMLYNQHLLSVTVSQENLGMKCSYCFSDQIDKLFSVLQLTIFVSVKRGADSYS